jgi:hypothetical protein
VSRPSTNTSLHYRDMKLCSPVTNSSRHSGFLVTSRVFAVQGPNSPAGFSCGGLVAFRWIGAEVQEWSLQINYLVTVTKQTSQVRNLLTNTKKPQCNGAAANCPDLSGRQLNGISGTSWSQRKPLLRFTSNELRN